MTPQEGSSRVVFGFKGTKAEFLRYLELIFWAAWLEQLEGTLYLELR